MAEYSTLSLSDFPTFTGVYVFGDSLVDPGNALKAAEFVGHLPFTSIPDGAPTPDKGYFLGRFSDGYTFADLISNKLLGAATRTTFPYGFEDPLLHIPITLGGKPEGVNLSFAYGGAQVIRGDELVPDLDEQTDAYRHYTADPNALYVITIGGNDVRSLVPDGDPPVTGVRAQARLQAVANEIADEVAQLFRIGARHVLVTGIPDVGLIPDYQDAADEAARRSLATQYATQLDELVKSALDALPLPAGAHLYDYDFLAFTEAVKADPAAFRLSNLTDARTEVQKGALDPVGSGFLFFDNIHPSAQAHALVAADMLAVLGGEPEAPVAAQSGPRILSMIEAQGGSDSYGAVLQAGATYTIDALGVSSGSGMLADPRVRVLDPSGAVVASDDDGGLGLDARVTFVARAAGAYTVEVSGVGVTRGDYVLQGADLRGAGVTVDGSALDDILGATAGANYLRGNAGNDSIAGGSGFDDINGNTGNDTAIGGAGDDWVLGGQDNDRLFGDAGGDIVFGNRGDDSADGGAGADVVRGGQGSDLVLGGDGDDWLAGDLGADTITGGAGADVFHTFGETGLDLVTDFQPVEGDRVFLLPGATYAVDQVGADTVISLAGGGQMVLVGVTAANLPVGWIF